MLMRMLEAVQRALLTSDHLRRPPWRGSSNIYAGHCYVAAEALFHLMGGKAAGLTPHTVRVDDVVHWFLKDAVGAVLDPTAAQFAQVVPYHLSRGRGFLTREPSRRARRLMEKVY
jgi:hypothetical protein